MEEAKRKPIETLKRTSTRRHLANSGSAREETQRNLGQGFRRKTLEGQKPKGGTSDRRVKTSPVARDFRKGKTPETEACRAGLTLRRKEQRQAKR
jgi:hypothetical protein